MDIEKWILKEFYELDKINTTSYFDFQRAAAQGGIQILKKFEHQLGLNLPEMKRYEYMLNLSDN